MTNKTEIAAVRAARQSVRAKLTKALNVPGSDLTKAETAAITKVIAGLTAKITPPKAAKAAAKPKGKGTSKRAAKAAAEPEAIAA